MRTGRSINKLAMCFALWMFQQPGEGTKVSVDEVREKWVVSRATAYRLLSTYRDARSWSTKGMTA